MPKRIGFIQTRGIGDVIIALPIADYFIENDWQVVWPLDQSLVPMFKRARPDIEWHPIDPTGLQRHDYFINQPVQILVDHDCDRIVNLYSHFGGINICDMRLDASLKFDEYKYAVAGVPFERKWKLKYERDMGREEQLFESLKIEGEYVCVHDQGSTMSEPFPIPKSLTNGLKIIRVEPLTDSAFDWRLTLERARRIVAVDSWVANFVEQLNLENDKAVFLQWGVRFTPVFANEWRFIFPPAMPPAD